MRSALLPRRLCPDPGNPEVMWHVPRRGDSCTSCVQEGGFEGGPENGPKQRRINNRLLSHRPQHRSGTDHNHLIVWWFSLFRNCAEIFVWYKTATSPPLLCTISESPFRRLWKLYSPGSFSNQQTEPQCRSLEDKLAKRGALRLGN